MLSTTAEFASRSTRRNGVYAGQPTIPQFPELEPVAADNVGVVTVYLYLIEREAGSRNAGTLLNQL